MVNTICFCSLVDFPNCVASGGPCSSSLDETGLLLWMNNTCGNVTGFAGMPDNWTNALSVMNNTFSKPDSFPWPSCLSGAGYPDCQLSSTETSCTRTLCNGIDANGNCSPLLMVDMTCFCSQVKFGRCCTANCGLSWDRPQYLKWLNASCSSQVPPGTSLPLNWTLLLSVQRTDLLPWSWQLASDLTPSNGTQPIVPQLPVNSSPLLQ
jgi:hypothetical protein